MTVYERLADSFDGTRRLARARLRYNVLGTLHRSLESSKMTKTQLADRLGVRKSAVSQVFGGDGNLRVNTIADYLAGMGCELELQIVPEGTARRRKGEEKPRLDLVWDAAQPMRAIVDTGAVRPDVVGPWAYMEPSAAANG